MKTTAIDTNALLGYRLQRKPHFQKVKKLFENALSGKEQIFIPNAVFLECEWVLRSFYKQSKEQVVGFFQELLLLDTVILKDKNEIVTALHLYRTSPGVNFTDCVILAQIQNIGLNDFLTFDEDLKKLYKEVARS